MRLRLLSADEIDLSLSMNEAIEVISQAFALFSSGQVILPMRETIEMPLGTSLFMPAYLETGALALKMVSVFPKNSQVGASNGERPGDRFGFPDRPAASPSRWPQADGLAHRCS
jgi:ornithine cyclodeaminase/alanine dehydrogenase-like protein (mu-crystallin family)